jgi:hypothetical protein
MAPQDATESPQIGQLGSLEVNAELDAIDIFTLNDAFGRRCQFRTKHLKEL